MNFIYTSENGEFSEKDFKKWAKENDIDLSVHQQDVQSGNLDYVFENLQPYFENKSDLIVEFVADDFPWYTVNVRKVKYFKTE